MPHIPDHRTHDPELVAAYAAGDATGPELAAATALVADCPECAALHRDLRAIATALPELPAAARPRDFRISPARAASLRPSGWRGVLAAFASPRFSLAAPLGTGLAAVGIAGLLLANPGGLALPTSGPTSGAAGSGTAVDAALGATGSSAAQAPDEQPEISDVPGVLASAAASSGPIAPVPAASAAASLNAAAVVPDGDSPGAAGTGTAAPAIRSSTTAGGPESSGDATTHVEMKSPVDAFAAEPGGSPVAPPADGSALAPVAVALIVAGLALVALRIGARLIA